MTDAHAWAANARKRYNRIKAKADDALVYALSPLGCAQDLIEFERLAEAQQLAAGRHEAILRSLGHG